MEKINDGVDTVFNLNRYLIMAIITVIAEGILMLLVGFEGTFLACFRVTISVNFSLIVLSSLLAILFAFIPCRGLRYGKRYLKMSLLIITVVCGLWGIGFLFVFVFKMMGYLSY